jgi:glutathione S-transferase
MALTLHIGNRRYSSWSLRGYLIVARSGAAFDTNVIFLDVDDTAARIAKVSPAGRVPVLVDGDLSIWDTLAIGEYMNELRPAAQLWPADRARRARARSISAEMHSGFVELRTHMPVDLCSTRRGHGHTPGALADARRVQSIWSDALAASGGPFLFGQFTIADAMFAPVVTRFATYGVDVDTTCRTYMETIEALPEMVSWRADAANEQPIAKLKL